MNIRLFKESDFEMVNNWWIKSGTTNFNKDFICPTTFIIECEDIPLACMSLYMLPIKEYAILENLVGNPDFKMDKRREAVAELVKYCEFYAKIHGYKKLQCLSVNEKTTARYQELGYQVTCDHVTSFVKDL